MAFLWLMLRESHSKFSLQYTDEPIFITLTLCTQEDQCCNNIAVTEWQKTKWKKEYVNRDLFSSPQSHLPKCQKISKSNDMCLHLSKSLFCTLWLRILISQMQGVVRQKAPPLFLVFNKLCHLDSFLCVFSHCIYQDLIIRMLGLVI